MSMYFSCNKRGYYIWQKYHQGKLIRFDLRTRDFHTAILRSNVILSKYFRNKDNNLTFDEMRSLLISERDSYIEYEIKRYAEDYCWGNNVIQNNKIQDEVKHLISDVSTEWYRYMYKKWQPLTLKSNQHAVNLFIEWYGDKDIRTVTKEVVSNFKNKLVDIYPSEVSRQSIYRKVAALFNFSVNHKEYIIKNPFTGMGFINPESLNKKKSVVLSSHEKTLTNVRYGSTEWWLLQILYHTGMRITEVIQLTHDDYITINDKDVDIHCISINKNNGKRVKNKDSIRIIPLHENLIRHRVMDIKPIFPWNTYHMASYIVTKLFRTIGEKHSPHDYRYGMSDRLRDIENLPDHIRFRILGHSNNTITDSIYRSKEPILLMKNAIDKT